MKNKWIALAALLMVVSCMHQEDHHANSVASQIAQGEKNYTGVNVSSEAHTQGLKTHPVDMDGVQFHIRERMSEINSFPCSDCHNQALDKLKDQKNQKGQKAHWDIKQQHAPEHTMNCITCHTESNMDLLHTHTGQILTFNDSYQLCGQCHFQQYKDWKGGAHGKRLASWAPPRISNTCTNCHNPHKPGFESRWPSRYNTHALGE